MRAFDTNVLAYAAGLRRIDADEAKIAHATGLLRAFILDQELVIPVQVLAELHHLLRRKSGLPADEVVRIVGEYSSGAAVVPTDEDVLANAFELSAQHDFQTYDAIILAAAAEADCEVLYSEDLQDGFVWRGVRVVNPFG